MNLQRKNCLRRRAGMTLIELIVAIVLIGTLTMIVPVMSSRQTNRQDLMWRIDSLRTKAMRSGRTQAAYLQDSTRFGAILALPTGELLPDSTLGIKALAFGVDR